MATTNQQKERVLKMLVVNRLVMMLNKLADATGTCIAPLTFFMMLLTCVVVIGRYWFNTGLTPVAEGVMFLHACVFMLGIAYTLRAGGHVRVDIIYQRLSGRGKAFIDLLGAVFFLFPFTAFIFIASLDYVGLSWRLQEGSPEPGGLPGTYLLKSLIPLMAMLLGLQGIAEVLRCLQILVPEIANDDASQNATRS
jgi:TRAP-type mannitol/chloroaromatic compound transport system permease small subunit